MAFTKIVGAGIHTLSNVHTHNVNSSGIITATSFVGPLDGTTGDFSGNVIIGGNLTVNGTTTTLDTNLTEVDKVEVAANNTTVGVAITQSGSGDILRLYDGSTQVVTIDDEGKVGLGTNNPSSPGSYTKFLEVSDNNASSIIVSRSASGTAHKLEIGAFSGASLIESTGSTSLRFKTNSEERLRIRSDGRVGINTNNPQNNGSVQHYTSTTRHQSFQSNQGDLAIVSDNNSSPVVYIKGTGSADLLNVFDNTTEVFTIKDGGNVGIGTDNPSQELEIWSDSPSIRLQDTSPYVANQYGNISQSEGVLQLTGRGDGSTHGSIFFYCQNDSEMLNSYRIADNYHLWYISGEEKMRLIGGRLGIGTNNPNNPLTIHGSSNHIYLKDTATDNNLQIRHSGGVSEFNSFGTGGARRPFVFNQYASEVLRISSTGLVGINTSIPSGRLNLVGSDSQIFNIVQDTGDLTIRLNDRGSSSSYIKIPDGSGALTFETGGSESLRITSTGIVQIGDTHNASTYGWDARLKVAVEQSGNDPSAIHFGESANGSANPAINFIRRDGSTLWSAYAGQISYDTGKFVFATSANTAPGSHSFGTRMVIKHDGKVGIDIQNPVARLHVHNSGTSAADHAYAHFTTGDTGSTISDGLTVGVAANQVASVNFREAGTLVLNTSGTPRIRIFSDGDVGIGTDNVRNNARLQVSTHQQVVAAFEGTGVSDPQIYVGDNMASPTDNCIILGYDKADNRGYLTVGGDGDNIFTVTNGGNIGISQAAPTSRLHVNGGNIRVDISTASDGILGEAYSGYFGLKHTDQTLSTEYMIISNDTHTYVSCSTGSNVYIRPSGNNSAHELIVAPNITYTKGSFAAGNVTIDPDSYGSYTGGFGNINDGGGWGARGMWVHGGGTGDAAAIAHNGSNLYFGIQNGSGANSMATYMMIEPTGDITMEKNVRLIGTVLRRSQHHTGHLEGSYNNVGANGAKSNPIYTIGSNYNPAENTLSNMYGIGWCSQSASFTNQYHTAGWGLYTSSAGVQRIFLNAGDGRIFASAAYCRTSHHRGHLEGGHQNIGDTANKTSPIYTIGSSYNPNETTLSNMYGVGYANGSSASFLPAGGWGMYVASDGDARIFLDAGNGYLNFNGGSGVVMFSNGTWSGEHSTGKIQTHGTNMYFQNAGGTWQFRKTNGTAAANIASNGTYTASDLTFKKDVVTITNAVDTIKKLTGRSFTWKEDDKKSFGVIAQEVETVLPELVSLTDEPEGSAIEPSKMVNYSAFAGHFIEAIKELSAKLETLEQENTALKARVTTLEG